MLDQLLCNGGRNSCKHKECRLDGVVRLDNRLAVMLVDTRSQDRIITAFSPMTVVSCYEAVIALSLHVFEGRKERPVAKGIFYKR